MQLTSQHITLLTLLILIFTYPLVINNSYTKNFKVTEIKPSQLTDAARKFNYGGVERAFSSLSFDELGQYIPSNKFASQLMIELNTNAGIFNLSVLERIEFLLKKQHPNISHDKLISLFKNFIIYKQKKDLIESIYTIPENAQNHINQTKYIIFLQEWTFGETLSDRLFGDQRRLNNLFLMNK
jgi:hypothetical protein